MKVIFVKEMISCDVSPVAMFKDVCNVCGKQKITLFRFYVHLSLIVMLAKQCMILSDLIVTKER